MTELPEIVLKRFERCYEAEQDNRDRAKAADKFSAGLQQWPETVKKEREADGRPCLVMDETNQYINQVKNDQRQNRAAIKVRPVDDKGDKKLAEMLQGVIRHIEDTSSADIAYDTAFEQAMRGGYGYWRVYTEYCDEKSFDQDIKIGRIRNRFSVYLDPEHQQPDGSDARYGFICEWMSRDDFKDKYPNADPVDFKKADAELREWATEDSVRIAEYFFLEPEKKTLVQLPDGTAVLADEIGDAFDYEALGLKTRETEIPKVRWQKISGKEVLEETDWAGKYVPIVKVIGNEFDDEGEVILTGIVHSAMDAMRMHNYSVSAFVENVALAPKAPWLAAAGQIEKYSKQWQDANRRNIAVLTYDPIENNGNAVPPPTRTSPPGLSMGWEYVIQASRTWVQAAMGMYAASVGAEGQEKSGKAILARQREGDVSTFHYHDNLARSIRHTGRILVDLIPKIYDTKRVVRILGEDGTPDQVMFDPNMPMPSKEVRAEDGTIRQIYNPTIGKYDVTVSTGPSYTTKRQEAAESQMQMVQAAPQLLPIVGDIMVRNMDWPGADDIADRLKAMLPPQLQALEKENQSPTDPQKLAEMVAKVQQAMQMIEQRTQELQQAEQQIKDEKTQVDGTKSEIKAEIAKLDAAKRILAAEQAVFEAEVRAAKAEQDAQMAKEENARTRFEYEQHLASMQQPSSNPTGGSPGY